MPVFGFLLARPPNSGLPIIETSEPGMAPRFCLHAGNWRLFNPLTFGVIVARAIGLTYNAFDMNLLPRFFAPVGLLDLSSGLCYIYGVTYV